MSVDTAARPESVHRSGTDPHGMRVYTRGAVTPQWLATSALPSWHAARGGGRRLIRLRRGWLGGPHVELVTVGDPGGEVPWRQLAAQVDAGPRPADGLSGAAYLEMARQRGRLENVPPPYLPLREHGEVQVVTAGEVIEDAPLDQLRSVLEATMAPAVVATIQHAVDEPRSLAGSVIGILTSVADTHPLGAGYGTFSLRSHAEALLAWLSPTTDLRPQFEQRYDAQRHQLVATVQRVLDGAADPVQQRWTRAFAYGSGVVDESVRQGRLVAAMLDERGSMAPGQQGPPGAAHVAPVGDAPDTHFHRTVHGSGLIEGAGEWFTGYRLLINTLYAQLLLLDVSPLQRAFSCYAVAEAVDEVLGQSWSDRLVEASRGSEARHD